LETLLAAYGQRRLWAAAGWLLERHQSELFVPTAYLQQLEKARPRQPQYLARSERGGTLQSRWNLIVPQHLLTWEGQHDPS